jgi:hypothetical protein
VDTVEKANAGNGHQPTARKLLKNLFKDSLKGGRKKAGATSPPPSPTAYRATSTTDRDTALTIEASGGQEKGIAPSEAWERRMRCKEADRKPFDGTLRVESPPRRV